jgi:hypothetical protein
MVVMSLQKDRKAKMNVVISSTFKYHRHVGGQGSGQKAKPPNYIWRSLFHIIEGFLSGGKPM